MTEQVIMETKPVVQAAGADLSQSAFFKPLGPRAPKVYFHKGTITESVITVFVEQPLDFLGLVFSKHIGAHILNFLKKVLTIKFCSKKYHQKKIRR